MPDGRALDRIWITQGTSGYAAETRWFDPAGALVGIRVRGGSASSVQETWYGEFLKACAAPQRTRFSGTLCNACGPHPSCTRFLLPPYDQDPVKATIGHEHTPAYCPLRCGDGVLQLEEMCDDGGLVNGDGCSSSCTLEQCGDGVVQAREGCDDGNADDLDGCSRLCRIETCGDGLLQAGEQCDDGNIADDDGCDSDCNLRLTGLVHTRFAVCGLATDRTPHCFGRDDKVLSTVPDLTFRRLTAGIETVCGLDDAGFTTCWGNRARIYAWTPPQNFGPFIDVGPSQPYFYGDRAGRRRGEVRCESGSVPRGLRAYGHLVERWMCHRS